MKIVKFRDYLVPLILSGDKKSTWRLFDDKDLSMGDEIELREFGKIISFAKAKITEIIIKAFKDLNEDDKGGHETFNSNDDMYKTYSDYYDTTVGPETKLKIIKFELLERF